MITRDNYEIYFMDYLDGVLPDEYEAELRAFLLVHPDLRELLEGMNEVRLQPGGEVFEKKRELKQQVNEKEVVYHAIAEAEGVITDEERRWVEENVERDEFEREVEAFKSVRMKPESGYVFEGKDALRRRPAVIVFMKRYAGVAAVVLFAVVLVMFLTREKEFPVYDLPQQTVKAEMPSLPDVPVKEMMVEPAKVQKKEKPRVAVARDVVPEVVAERVEPVSLIESRKNVVVAVEILAPRPDEMLVSPYEGVSFRVETEEPRARAFRIIAPDLESSDNILSSIVNAGRNVVNQLRSRDTKDEDNL